MTVPRDGKREIGEEMCIQLATRRGQPLDGYQDASWQRAVTFGHSAASRFSVQTGGCSQLSTERHSGGHGAVLTADCMPSGDCGGWGERGECLTHPQTPMMLSTVSYPHAE